MTTNQDTVIGIYEAFGRGDLPFILDRLADDISWDEDIRRTGLPYLRPGRGKDHVAGFFEALATTLEFTVFEPGEPCVAGDKVMVELREAARNLVTGATIGEDTFVHIWRFGPDGKVASFRHVGDWAPHEAAAVAPSRPEAATV